MPNSKTSEDKLMVGGQAVIEGVMMRSPEMVAVACRRTDGSIVVWRKPYRSLLNRMKFLALPIFRGSVVLIEALMLGVQALTFSGDVAMEDERAKQNGKTTTNQRPGQRTTSQRIGMGLMLTFAFALGLGLFFYVPLLLTEWLGARTGFWFNLVDGIIRLIIFLGYLWLITTMKDIRRVFEYHGAEHKSVFNFEEKKELTPENASTFSRFHPRCGTSFLLIVMLVSILVFMMLGRPESIGDRLLRFAFIPVIGGISYEFIRLSDKGYRNSFWRLFILPGLWLQRLTTKEPDHQQLEVAIVALKAALGEEVAILPNVIVDDGKAVVAAA
ncbi:MAG: DUF1385 domain-containing protein [candidate division KSB1 bacterium]|nr:DUF1385 domain-containing protein [candidate division KSB1 bacterium]MDZ7302513.1 DUF1385 domain-containing protein [candidate division KSB1 bacterium]MDZ7311892.1 DUF1385 domain-containing protein [candidate division KSB1 bacterium]